ncbi:cytochrome c biogenesis protein ResB [Thermicanus aegyptius]|uniref:cytochrome c biogenesis protein ResB n=1 Tax=Thermicanus aegyptius TaxID=94009 RepID=UPI00048F8615|nr:cytochrome c biogenesis protein ResB [Thermicanus aegyptius]
MEQIKCSCGHVNPPGTSICEACGKPLEESDQPLNMRYEGAARRSNLAPHGVIDHLWKFFSSVKVAIWMIAIALVASIIGTILPQEQFKQSSLPAEQFYPQTYGWFGQIYYTLGFHRLFYSWWYILLLLMIGISLIICSLDRFIPLYKALNRQRLPRHMDFFRRQRIFWEGKIEENPVELLAEVLKRKHYALKREGDLLLAEKGKISRWGPYINHIGLILILLSVMLRFIPGFYLDEYVWVWDGETKKIPGTNYYVKNVDFQVQYYEENEFPEKIKTNGKIVKNYQTDAILYEEINGSMQEVKRGEIQVNHPFEYNGLYLYQSGSQPDQIYALRLNLIDKRENKNVGEIELSLYDPKSEFDLAGGIKVKVLEYYPDFALNEEKLPYSKSNVPNRPAYVVETISPDVPQGEKSWVIAGVNGDDLTPNNRYRFDLANFTLKDRTGLMVRVDRGLPALYVSMGIVMMGLVMGFYWQHRRIWVNYKEGTLYLAAHTNKNWFGLKKELEGIAKVANLPLNIKELDRGGKKLR